MSKATDQQEEDLKPVLDKDEQKESFMNWLEATLMLVAAVLPRRDADKR
jgi:hypothetical protein